VNLNSDTYSIQEASELAKISKHTLRFWEKELNGIIVPHRTNGGQRRYTQQDLIIIEEIKKLKMRGHSLPDIKQILNSRYPTINGKEKIDLLANQIAEVVKSTLYNFLGKENTGKKT
jgi:DNA-binding transcriptional MerR regulator